MVLKLGLKLGFFLLHQIFSFVELALFDADLVYCGLVKVLDLRVQICDYFSSFSLLIFADF